MIFFLSQGSPLWIISEFEKMQKIWIFLFFEIRTPFFDSILRTAPGTILNHCHQVRPPVLRRNQHFDARAFVSCCCSQAPQLKKVNFPKIFPYCNSARIFHFLYPQTSLILFYLIRFLVGASFQGSGSGFVFAEGAKIVKKSVPKSVKKACYG